MRLPAALMLFVLCIAGSLPARADSQRVDGLRRAISFRYPGTDWVAREELVDWLARPDAASVVLLDVRSAEEFETSHLAGAQHVDPDANADSLGPWPRSAPIVVYCSVGYRSAALARKLSKAGYEKVFNLQGGIFGWANDGGELQSEDGPANRVHPYSRLWGRFLEAKYHPDAELPEDPGD